MTNLSSSLAAMVTDRNNWRTNAHTAYDSGIWGTGTHWHARYDTLNGQYASMTADRNAWRTNANAAYDSGTWGTGNLWSADAHNDPNVWTNRYNAGVAAGDAAGRAAVMPAGSGGSPVLYSVSGTFTTNGQSMSVTLDRTGFWVITVTPTSGSATLATQTSGGVPQFNYSLTWPGSGTGTVSISQAVNSSNTSGTARYAFGLPAVAGVLGAGAVTFTIGGLFAMTFSAALQLIAYFVPTPSYPH